MPTESLVQIEPAPALRRELGLRDAVGVGLGAIVGAGIFVVIGVAAGIAGPSLLAGLVLAALVATCNALSSAQLAARFPTSGGTYEYGYQVVHPHAGFAAGWTFLASKIAAGGTVALGFGSYCAQLFPGVSARGAGVAAVVLLTVANLFGVKKAGRLNQLIVAVTLSSLIYFVIRGLPNYRPENLVPFSPAGYGSTLQSAAILFFAYTGYARIATLAEEVREPSRTIPRAILISLGSATLLYFLVAFTAVGAVGADAISRSSSPLATVALRVGSQDLVAWVGVGATTAMLGVLLSQVLGISRVMLAMARRHDLPGFLNHVHGRWGVPDRAILFTGTVILLLTLFGTIEWVVSTATFAILLYYTVTNIAALRMEKSDKRYPDVIAGLGLVACLTLAASLPLVTIGSGMALVAIGFGFRAALNRHRSRTVAN